MKYTQNQLIKFSQFFKDNSQLNLPLKLENYSDPIELYKKGHKIRIKKENRGKFTEYCGGNVTDTCIQKGKNSSDPKIRKRATFAANARTWKKQNGGTLIPKNGIGGALNVLNKIFLVSKPVSQHVLESLRKNPKAIKYAYTGFKGVKPDIVRLYRASGTNGKFIPSSDGTAKYAGMWFTNNPRKPLIYASYTRKKAIKEGIDNPIELQYIDIPKTQLEKYKASNIIGKDPNIEYEVNEDFLIPLDMKRNRVPLEGITGNLLRDTRLPIPKLDPNIFGIGAPIGVGLYAIQN